MLINCLLPNPKQSQAPEVVERFAFLTLAQVALLFEKMRDGFVSRSDRVARDDKLAALERSCATIKKEARHYLKG